MNYLRCPYDVQEKISSYVKKKNCSTTSIQHASPTIIIILMIFGSHGLKDLELVV